MLYRRQQEDVVEPPAADGQQLALAANFNRSVRPYIELVDRLRQIGLERDLSLPSIVVVGDQRSDKSSVLEDLPGIQLSRGAGQ